jgi:uncharacterized protein (TIGR02569 family)
MIPGRVLRAFGLDVDVALRPVGKAFVAGDLVLKQVEDAGEAAWCAETMAGLRADGVRLPAPVRSDDGAWVVDGWVATEKVSGRPAPRWNEVIDAGRAFHRALVDVARPAALDTRTHRWARAERQAWGEEEAAPSVFADALLARTHPLDLPSQVVHGDLAGNVLFAAGLEPAVIDFSPYWRPQGWALAVVVVDAVVWNHAPFQLAHALDEQERDQLLARATLFRLFSGEPSGPYEHWVAHLCDRLDRQ